MGEIPPAEPGDIYFELREFAKIVLIVFIVWTQENGVEQLQVGVAHFLSLLDKIFFSCYIIISF
jgi:hypothetical protein